MRVLDASIAVKLLIPEADSAQALVLFLDTINAGRQVLAPALLRYEGTNIIRRRMLNSGLSLADAQTLLTSLAAYPLTYTDPSRLHHEAVAIAIRCRRPAAYDAHYLALTQH